MTTPHTQPSCPHVTVVVVNEPHQIVHDGQTYLAGDMIADVPNPTAAEWIAHGWAQDVSSAQAAPAKKPPAKTAARK
jgi:hypothetical protein